MYRFGAEEVKAVTQVIRSGQWFRYGTPESGHRGEAMRFEEEWSRKFRIPHAGFVSSGTAALMCCYAGLGIGPGDEVIIPGYTWIASATAVLTMGAIPVIVDVDASLMLDPDAVERAITPRTRAICPVHMVGLACDMDKLLRIARNHGLAVVEDACQCDGGVWRKDRRIGTLGDMGAYSFNFYKVIACGDGGLFSARKREHFEKALIFHDAGIGFRGHAKDLSVPIFAGMNLRGNEILAAMMRVQLGRLDGIVKDLHNVHRAISGRVAGTAGLAPIPYNGSRGIGTQTGTGATLGFQFPTEAAARAFTAAFNTGLKNRLASAYLPIDSGRHVYCNWECVMQKRVLHTDAMNAFRMPRNRGSRARFTKNMLPRTLEILKTTVLIGLSPDWTARQVDAVSRAIVKAVK